MADPLPARYAALLKLSERMLADAERLDWTAVADGERQRQALLGTLPATWPPLTADTAATLRDTIARIQTIDRAILELAEPSRAQLAALLAGLAGRSAAPPATGSGRAADAG